MTTSASASSSAARLIALRPQVAAALDPVNLVRPDLSVTPRTAGLSLLSSRASFWEAHAATVAFAVDYIGGGAPSEVVDLLANQEGLSGWFRNGAFLDYIGDVDFATPGPALIRAAEVIETGLAQPALRAAQFGTVLIEYCAQQCKGDLQCMQECLNS